jgi:osmoprotectant transport system permease protein
MGAGPSCTGERMSIVSQTIAWLTDPANWQGPNGIPVRMAEQVAISGASLLIAALIALPIGLWIGHTGRGANFAVNLANLGRALPSLAVIGLVWPITVAIDPQLGFKVYPTLIAMVILAIPPILVNAYTGISEVDRDLTEAARGMGYRERQVLSGLEMPLALPVTVGGLRSAAVQVVATATLGAIFGFGGLGRYLVDGIAQNDEGQLWGGVVLVAGLALTTEGLFALLQRLLTSPGLRQRPEPGAGAGRTAPSLPPVTTAP